MPPVRTYKRHTWLWRLPQNDRQAAKKCPRTLVLTPEYQGFFGYDFEYSNLSL